MGIHRFKKVPLLLTVSACAAVAIASFTAKYFLPSHSNRQSTNTTSGRLPEETNSLAGRLAVNSDKDGAGISLEHRLEKPTFETLEKIAGLYGYKVSDVYNPKNEAVPYAILVGTEHTDNNLELLKGLLPKLVAKGEVLSIEGLDDMFEQHLSEGIKRFKLSEQDMAEFWESYKHQNHPYFTTLRAIAKQYGCNLKGYDNAALALFQTDVKGVIVEANEKGDTEMAESLKKLYFGMGDERTLTIAHQIPNRPGVHAAGLIHFGRVEGIGDHSVEKELQLAGRSYAILVPTKLESIEK